MRLILGSVLTSLIATSVVVPQALATNGYGYDDGLSVSFESSARMLDTPLTWRYCIAVDVHQLVDGAGNRLSSGMLHNRVVWGDGTSREFDWYSDTNYGASWASPDYGVCNDFAVSVVPYVIDLVLTDPYGHEVAFHDTWPAPTATALYSECMTVAKVFYDYVGYQVIRWGDLVAGACDQFDIAEPCSFIPDLVYLYRENCYTVWRDPTNPMDWSFYLVPWG